jgi:hypothetical protein
VDGREVPPQPGQRPQPDLDLDHGGRQEGGGQHRERERHGAGEGGHRLVHEPRVGRDREAGQPAALRDHRALEHDQARLGRARQLVAADLVRGGRVRRQAQHLVPERARAEQVSARPLHLPVEAGERAPEARVGEVDGEAGPAVGLEGERRGQLVELGGQILVEAALDVLPEQAGQDEACHHQRAGGPDQAAREQPEAERGRPQGSPSR